MKSIPSPLPLELFRHKPCLTFAPLAWLKLQFFCHLGDTEIGGFGVAAARDLLYVEDFLTLPQEGSPVTGRFFDEARAGPTAHCRAAGRALPPCARPCCHT